MDTSAIYHVNHIAQHQLKQSFYSTLALIELIAGITPEKFDKRKAIIGSLESKDITRDKRFPEEIIWGAFDIFEQYEFIEKRWEHVDRIISNILSAANYDDFIQMENARDYAFPFNYFVDYDQKLSRSFHEASVKGNALIREELKRNFTDKLNPDNKNEFSFSSMEEVKKFFENSSINNGMSILALANAAMNNAAGAGINESEQKIYESYNGSVNMFIHAWSSYSANLILQNHAPGRNDLQDLTHLFYLKENAPQKIITDDKIFLTILPSITLSVKEFLS